MTEIKVGMPVRYRDPAAALRAGYVSCRVICDDLRNDRSLVVAHLHNNNRESTVDQYVDGRLCGIAHELDIVPVRLMRAKIYYRAKDDVALGVWGFGELDAPYLEAEFNEDGTMIAETLKLVKEFK